MRTTALCCPEHEAYIYGILHKKTRIATCLSNIHYLVLLGVEHVVALLAETDAHKSRTFSGRLGHPLLHISLQTNKRQIWFREVLGD